jgi:hypothetical protein
MPPYLHTYIYKYKYIHIYIHTHTYIHAYICAGRIAAARLTHAQHTYIHAYIHTHTYIHTSIHTYIHTQEGSLLRDLPMRNNILMTNRKHMGTKHKHPKSQDPPQHASHDSESSRGTSARSADAKRTVVQTRGKSTEEKRNSARDGFADVSDWLKLAEQRVNGVDKRQVDGPGRRQVDGSNGVGGRQVDVSRRPVDESESKSESRYRRLEARSTHDVESGPKTKYENGYGYAEMRDAPSTQKSDAVAEILNTNKQQQGIKTDQTRNRNTNAADAQLPEDVMMARDFGARKLDGGKSAFGAKNVHEIEKELNSVLKEHADLNMLIDEMASQVCDMYVCMHVCVCMCVYVYIYYIYIYMYLC